MPPVSGNTRIICVAEQTAKGSPAAAPAQTFPLSADAALSPNREIITLTETDASSQRARNAVVGASPGGGWSGMWRDSAALFLAEMVQGAIAAGVATPTQAMPYFTAWDIIPGVMCTRYDDCRLGQLTVAGTTLQEITYTVDSVFALEATLNVAEPVIPALPTDLKFSYPHVQVRPAGVHGGTHDSFSIVVNRNLSYLRGDMGLAIYDTWPGLYEVTGQLVRIFESDDDFNKFHGGAAAATVLTTTIFSEALEIELDDGTNSALFESAGVEYTSYAAPLNQDGAPIIQTLDFATLPQATWADNLTITIA
jgi:Phage tail tube protein